LSLAIKDSMKTENKTTSVTTYFKSASYCSN